MTDIAKTLRVVAHIRARQGKEAELRKLLSSLVEPTLKETGCIRYQLHLNEQDPQDFTFIEEWESGASLDAHLQAPHIRKALAAVPDLVEAPPDIRRYRMIA